MSRYKIFFGARTTTGAAAHALTATVPSFASPDIGLPVFGQQHGLTATAVATGIPAVAAPIIGQTHGLSATAVVMSAPAVAVPAVGQTHGLAATPVATSAPTFTTTSLAQTHVLSGNAIATGPPDHGTPVLVSGATHALTANAVAPSSPAFTIATIGQTHGLSAVAVASSAPAFTSAVFAQTHGLSATAVATSAPAFTSAVFAQTHGLAATAVAVGAPAIGTPTLTELGDRTYVQPVADVAGGSWVNELGATVGLYGSIDEETPSDADYIASPENPSASVQRFKLGIADYAMGEPFSVAARVWKDEGAGAGTINYKVRLYQGTTQIVEWTHNNIGTAASVITDSLTAPQYAAITNFMDLYVEVEAG